MKFALALLLLVATPGCFAYHAGDYYNGNCFNCPLDKSRCIDNYEFCDGYVDCPSGVDEAEVLCGPPDLLGNLQKIAKNAETIGWETWEGLYDEADDWFDGLHDDTKELFGVVYAKMYHIPKNHDWFPDWDKKL